MKIGDKVVFRKIGDHERTGRIVGISKDRKSVAVGNLLDTFILHPSYEDIAVIEEKK